MATTGGRRARATVVSALLVAGLGSGAWALAGCGAAGDAPPSEATSNGGDRQRDNPLPAGAAGAAPPAPSTDTVPLPVPEPPPADEYAPTPEVVLGTLALPSLGVAEPMGEGVTLTAVDRGPGHWPGSAMPGGVGNVVVAGHRTTNSRPFHDLDLLEEGDPLVFTMPDGTTWSYEHTGTSIVEADALHIVDQTPARTATLFACHPKGSDAQRIVAHFRLVEA